MVVCRNRSRTIFSVGTIVRCVFSQNREISRLPFGREHTGSYDAGPSGRAEEFSSVLNGNRRNDGDVIATPSIDRFVDLRHSKVRRSRRA